MGFQFRLLGPLEAARDGTVVPVGPPKQRVLLASLLVHANQTVTVEALTGRVWAERPPANVRATLHNYVMRLRRALAGDDGGAAPIETRPEGYRLRVDEGGLDLHRFESLAGRAKAAERDGDVKGALVLWGEALGEWRDEPLVDVPSDVLRREVVPGLAERRLQALESRIEADLELGHHQEVAPELAELTARHPLRERFWLQRMLALYRCERTAEALACYRRLRERLDAELGIRPGAAAEDLHVRILRADPSLLAAEAPSGPAPAEADVPGDGADTAGAARVVPHQLPAAIGRLRGRAGEIDELDRWLRVRPDAPDDGAGPLIVGIVGVGGIGKTALALHWAHRHRDRFPDGQIYLNLRGYGPDAALEPGKALETLLRTLRPPSGIPADLEERAALFRSAIGDRRMLIILDNARDSTQVWPLLPGSACAVIVTSRDQIRGLAVRDGAHRIALRRIGPDATASLLADATGRPAETFDTGRVRELTELCAGLPLAVRVVAERIARNGEDLATAMTQLYDEGGRLDELSSGDADVTDIRSVLSWSCRALDPTAARAFRLIGAQPGPDIGLPAAAVLLGEAQPAARRTLDRLIAVHLVEQHRPGRYRMHDLLRIYATERFRAEDDEAVIGDLLDWYLQTSVVAFASVNPANASLRTRLDLPGDRVHPLAFDDMKAALDWFETEQHCLIAAVEYASAHGHDEHAWKIVWAMTDFFIRGKPFDQWSAVVTIGLAAARRAGSATGQGEMLDHFGMIFADLRRWDEALDCCRRRLELSRDSAGAEDEATAYNNLGWTLNRAGEPAQAVGHLTEAIRIYERLGNELGAVPALSNLGDAYVRQGRYRDAFGPLERALDIEARHPGGRNISFVLRHIGAAHAGLGEHDTALGHFRRALALNRYFNSQRLVADTLVSIGDSLAATGRATEAADHWTQALGIRTELGAPDADEVQRRLDPR